jgi:hypothetical protein
MNLAGSQSCADELVESRLDDPRDYQDTAAESERRGALTEQDSAALLAEGERRGISPVDQAASLIEETQLR